jgi:hypothetical protein
MTQAGQPERAAQHRVILLFRDELGYRYLNCRPADSRTARAERNATMRELTLTSGIPLG